MSVTLTLEDEIDIIRGDMLVRSNNQPEINQNIDIMICWMSEEALINKVNYALKHTSKEARCIVK